MLSMLFIKLSGKIKPRSGFIKKKMRLIVGLFTPFAIITLTFLPAIQQNIREAQAADESDWFIHYVDVVGKNGSADANSLAFDSLGNPAISYITMGELKLARWNGLSWDIETVDSTRTSQSNSGSAIVYSSNEDNNILTFDSSGNPAIVYLSRPDISGPGTILKYAHWTGSSWDIMEVDESTTSISDESFDLDLSGNPGIAYYINDNLKYAHWNGSSWDIQVVPGTEKVNNYLTYDTENTPIIASYDKNFQYAHWNGSSWDIRYLPQFPDSLDFQSSHVTTSLALDTSGNPYISYSDYSSRIDLFYLAGALKCLYWDGSSWNIQNVGDNIRAGVGSIDVDTSGNPAIAYYGEGGLEYANWDGTSWQIRRLDNSSYVRSISLRFDDNGDPAVSYTGDGYLNLANKMQMGNPDKPVNLSPAWGMTNLDLPVTLKSSANGTHVASQWQVTYIPGNYSNAAFDSGRDTYNLTQITVPQGKLTYAVTYYWRVRYQDSAGNWSKYSLETSFTTGTYGNTARDADFYLYEKNPYIPSAELVSNITVSEGQAVVLEDSSKGYITSWKWDLGDGTIVAWTSDNRPEDGKLFHVYSTKGSYTVTLTISSLGATDTETRENCIIVDKVLTKGETIDSSNGKFETVDKRFIFEFPADMPNYVISNTNEQWNRSFVSNPGLTTDMINMILNNSITQAMKVTIKEEGQTPPPVPGGFKAGATYFTVDVSDLVDSFLTGKEVTVTVAYSDDDVSAAGGDPQVLSLARYDEESKEWVILPTTVDTTAKTLNVTTDKFEKSIEMIQRGMHPPAVKWMVMAKDLSSVQEATFGFSLWIWITAGIGIVLIAATVLVLRSRFSIV